MATAKKPDSSVRLALSPEERALFDRWVHSFKQSRSSMATYMVQHFLRTVPSHQGLPPLPDPSQEPLL